MELVGALYFFVVLLTIVSLGLLGGWIFSPTVRKWCANLFGSKSDTSSRSSTTGPTCGRCGYSVRGATTFICPECGSDYRDCGIATPDMRRSGLSSGIVKIILWTILLPIPATIISNLFVSSVQPVVAFSQRYQQYMAKSEQFSLTVETNAKVWVWPWQQNQKMPSSSVDVSTLLRFAGPQGGQVLITLNPDTRTCSYKLPSVAQEDNAPWPTRSDVVLWLKSLGVDLATADAVNEIASIVSLIDTFDTTITSSSNDLNQFLGSFGSSWSSSGGSDSPEASGLRSGGVGGSSGCLPAWPWLSKSLLLFWFLLWLYGCWRFAAGLPFFPRRAGTAS